MKVRLEVTGGFTGKAGTQVIRLDLEQLSADEAAAIRTLIDALPESTWGGSFMSSHPKPWDFKHTLIVGEGEQRRAVTFHKGNGPVQLTTLAEWLVEHRA